MSVKKFIETGIIENYVLGRCTPDELRQVRTMKAKHPTVRAEIKAVREALAAYALKHEVNPPERLKEKVLSAIKTQPPKTDKRRVNGQEAKMKEGIKRHVKSWDKKEEAKTQEAKAPEQAGTWKFSDDKVPEGKIIEAAAPEFKTGAGQLPEEKTQEPPQAQDVTSPEANSFQETPQPAIQEDGHGEKKNDTEISPPTPVNRDNGRGFETMKSLLIAVSLTLLLASAYLNYFLYQRLQDVKSKLSGLKIEKESLAEHWQAETASLRQQLEAKQLEIKQQHISAENMRKNLAVLMTSYKAVLLTGEGAAAIIKKELYPGGHATVYWHHASKEVFVSVENLPPPGSMYQYRLWAVADGKALDAGALETDENYSALQRLKDVKNAQLFMITLENKGGSLKPTLESLYLAGKVS